MIRRGSSRVAVGLSAAMVLTAGASADEPPPVAQVLPPLMVPAPPADAEPAPASVPAALPPALESLPPLGPPVSVPATPAPVAAAPVVEIPPDRRPVLVVPGLPTPRRAVTAAPATDSGVLRLPAGRQETMERPSGMHPEPAPATAAPAPSPMAEPLPDGPPPIVSPADPSDPLLADGPPPLVPPNGPVAVPEGRPRLELPAGRSASAPSTPILSLEPDRGRPRDTSSGPDTSHTVDAGAVPESPEGSRAPSRRRLFGLFRAPTPAPANPPPAPVAASEPTRIESRNSETIQVEPRSDPAADAALKRRLEAQIQGAMGNQLRALDVRVVDRTIHVRAAVTRFWQKRAARRTLETLPALAGYRTRIEVID